MKLVSYFASFTLFVTVASQSWDGETIPKAAWRRPLSQSPTAPMIKNSQSSLNQLPK